MTTTPLNVEALRKDFPLLTRTVHDRPIVYLDSASSALQPQAVINAMATYYETTHANVHRGVYATAEEATHLYEQARAVVGRFIGAPVAGRRDRLQQEHDRIDQPGGAHLGPGQSQGRRSHPADRDGAPRQHRAVAHAGRRGWPRAALHTRRRRGSPRPHRPDHLGGRRQAGGRLRHVERPRHHQSDRRDRRRRPQRRCARPGRRRAARAPRARSTSPHSGPTSSLSPATR